MKHRLLHPGHTHRRFRPYIWSFSVLSMTSMESLVPGHTHHRNSRPSHTYRRFWPRIGFISVISMTSLKKSVTSMTWMQSAVTSMTSTRVSVIGMTSLQKAVISMTSRQRERPCPTTWNRRARQGAAVRLVPKTVGLAGFFGSAVHVELVGLLLQHKGRDGEDHQAAHKEDGICSF